MKTAVHGVVTRRVTRRANATAPGWTTPALLRLGLYATSFVSLLLMIIVLTAVFSAREALTKVGRQAAPAVLAADRIQVALTTLDRSAVTELLSRYSNRLAFEERRQQAADAILNAAENISYRRLEQEPLQKLGSGLGSYTTLIQQARDAWKSGDIEIYDRAAAVMDGWLMPAADRLDKNMTGALESAYSRQRETAKAVNASLVFSTLLTGFVLLSLQWFLAVRTRRLINPLLFAATIALVAFSGYSAQALEREDHDFQTAKEDLFDHTHLGLQAMDGREMTALNAIRHKLDPAHFPTSPNTEPALAELSLDADAKLRQRINDAFRDIDGFEISTPVSTLFILLFTFMGVLPRLREYSA